VTTLRLALIESRRNNKVAQPDAGVCRRAKH